MAIKGATLGLVDGSGIGLKLNELMIEFYAPKGEDDLYFYDIYFPKDTLSYALN